MSLKKAIKYREVWMGLAILWIVWFHSGLQPENEILNFIKKIGYGGVDIFLFASGIGCYYSLDKDSDSFNFIKRRIIRIIPTYWTFLLFWIPYKRMADGMSLRAALGNILCIRNFTGLGGEFNWYISAMWLMYLLAPFFKGLVDKLNAAYKVILVTIFLVLFSVCFWDVYVYIVTVTRIPIFFLGMYAGKLAKQDFYISKKCLGILMAVAMAGFGLYVYWQGIHQEDMWYKGYHWYPFILITPGLCVAISWLFELLKKKAGEGLQKVISIPGKFSFEIYLLHIWFFDILEYNLIENGIIQNSPVVWLIAIVALIPSCLILHYVQKLIMYVVNGVLKKNRI